MNTLYSYFYQIGKIVVYQIFFTQDVDPGDTIATLPYGCTPKHQFWSAAVNSFEGTTTKRISVKTEGVVVAVADVPHNYFASGFFIIE